MYPFRCLFKPTNLIANSVVAADNLHPQVLFATCTEGRRAHTTKCFKPLRVLFCGSDDFSGASLRALNDLRQRNSNLVASIDVLCRPGKRYGRNLRNIRDVPVKAVAQGLGLNIHELDTFTGWQLPRPQGESINLIIAVSFGLFVPPRILGSAQYGGLNVHPSRLPDFRGPAPLQHTLLAGETVTGVTLQSLDHRFFDHGVILAQTEPPWFKIPHSGRCSYLELLDFITPKAASLLVEGIENGVFVPPLVEVRRPEPVLLRHAPKITSRDREIDWPHWCSITVDRRHRALGRLWSNVWLKTNNVQRFLFEDVEVVSRPHTLIEDADIKIEKTPGALDTRHAVHTLTYSLGSHGEKGQQCYIDDGEAIIIATRDGTAIRVKEITTEGYTKRPAKTVMQENRTRLLTGHARDISPELKPRSGLRSEMAGKATNIG